MLHLSAPNFSKTKVVIKITLIYYLNNFLHITYRVYRRLKTFFICHKPITEFETAFSTFVFLTHFFENEIYPKMIWPFFFMKKKYVGGNYLKLEKKIPKQFKTYIFFCNFTHRCLQFRTYLMAVQFADFSIRFLFAF